MIIALAIFAAALTVAVVMYAWLRGPVDPFLCSWCEQALTPDDAWEHMRMCEKRRLSGIGHLSGMK